MKTMTFNFLKKLSRLPYIWQEKIVVNFEKMTFIFKKIVTVNISLTFKIYHNKQICDIF